MKEYPVKQILWNLLLIAAGSILYAIAVNGILVPKGLAAALSALQS